MATAFSFVLWTLCVMLATVIDLFERLWRKGCVFFTPNPGTGAKLAGYRA